MVVSAGAFQKEDVKKKGAVYRILKLCNCKIIILYRVGGYNKCSIVYCHSSCPVCQCKCPSKFGIHK